MKDLIRRAPDLAYMEWVWADFIVGALLQLVRNATLLGVLKLWRTAVALLPAPVYCYVICAKIGLQCWSLAPLRALTRFYLDQVILTKEQRMILAGCVLLWLWLVGSVAK
jgi:hypothetical protein